MTATITLFLVVPDRARVDELVGWWDNATAALSQARDLGMVVVEATVDLAGVVVAGVVADNRGGPGRYVVREVRSLQISEDGMIYAEFPPDVEPMGLWCCGSGARARERALTFPACPFYVVWDTELRGLAHVEGKNHLWALAWMAGDQASALNTRTA
jgi:hypothetical protein